MINIVNDTFHVHWRPFLRMLLYDGEISLYVPPRLCPPMNQSVTVGCVALACVHAHTARLTCTGQQLSR
jgi:hypothetical protein